MLNCYSCLKNLKFWSYQFVVHYATRSNENLKEKDLDRAIL